MWKKIVAIPLVLIVVLSFTACAEEAGLPSAQEIIDGVIEAQDDIRAYEFEMDMTLDMAGEVEGEAIEMTMGIAFNGALDLDNRQMRMDLTMDAAIPGQDEMEMAVEMYLIDDMGYVFMDVPGEEPVWMKEQFSESDWQEIIQVMVTTAPQIELLQTAQVRVIGSERVKGVDCYVLQLTPDMDQLWQLATQQAALGGQGMSLPEIPEEVLDEVFSDFSVKQWVAKDTYFLMKAEIDMAMELTAEALGFPGEEGEMTMDITLSFLAYNYNESISIVVPPEALEATEGAEDFLGAGAQEAAKVEFANIQTAVFVMMVDNEIATLPNPVTVATSDMNAFPDAPSTVTVDKINDPDGTAYQTGDKDGYILYQHDKDADNTQDKLVNYVVSQYTMGTYTVDANGTVTQVTTGFE